MFIPDNAFKKILAFCDDRIEVQQKKNHTAVMEFIKYFKQLSILIRLTFTNQYSTDYELSLVEHLFELESEFREFSYQNRGHALFCLELWQAL